MTEMIQRPDEGGEPPAVYYPGMYPYQMSETPDWAVMKPPYDPNSEVQKVWSTVVAPLRGVAIAFLWLTVAWWRFGTAAALIIAIYLILSGQGQGGK